MYEAWAEGSLEPRDRTETFVEGLATGVPFALTTRILRERLHDFRLVTDEEIRDSVARLLADEHVLVEGASAAALAGAQAMADEIAGSTVVLQVSGRNMEVARVRELLASQLD